jgi:hypothetical protein
MKITGVSGLAGAGKGEAAKILEDYFSYARVSFADEIKRTVRRWWPNFLVEEMWGPSEARSRVHPEYGGLTARRACQFIGTEVGRNLDANVWVRSGLDVARKLLEGGCWYSCSEGLTWSASARRPSGVVFDDARFENELSAIQAVGGKTWKIVRPDASTALTAEAAAHESEHALDGYDDAKFDAIIINNKSLADLKDIVCRIASTTL